MIVELTIPIQIKIANGIAEILGHHFSEAVFPLELSELLSINDTSISSINSFESSVGFKISHCCQDLPQFLDCYLLFSVIDKNLFDF